MTCLFALSVSFNFSYPTACWDPEPHHSNQNTVLKLDPPKILKMKYIAQNTKNPQNDVSGINTNPRIFPKECVDIENKANQEAEIRW